MIEKKVPLREIYVWQLPVRIFHWVNATCIFFLIISGLLIAYPPALAYTEGAEQYGFWFAYLRFTHYVLGIILIVNFGVRIYWMFAGNKFARWNNYIPLSKRQWRGIYDTVKVDVFLLSPKPIYDIGHNSLAATTYGGIFVVMIAQAITGLCLWSPTAEIVGAHMFESLAFKLGGLMVVKQIHFYLMWLFVLFIIIHVYLVFYHDYIERSGIASSIIGGWKFIDEEVAKEYEGELAREEIIKKEKKIEKDIEEIEKKEKASQTN